MNESKIKKDAKTIANIIGKTDTDHRGSLLMEVAKVLSHRSQSFTSEVMDAAAMRHGVYTSEADSEDGFN